MVDVGLAHLREAGGSQAAVAAEESAVRTENRPGGESGQFIASVGFTKRTMRDAKSAQSLHALVQLNFVRDAANDEMRMR